MKSEYDKRMNAVWRLEEPYLIDKDDNRYDQAMKEIKERGFDESETWSLDLTIVDFIIPRLERFCEITDEVNHEPLDEYKEILEGLKLYQAKNDWTLEEEEVNWPIADRALKLLAENFDGLWW